MNVKEIMTESVIYAEVPGSASEALEKIIKNNISGLPVVKKGTKELLGIATRNDFSKHPEETQLALLMTRDVASLEPETDLRAAAKLFLEKDFRRLPIVKNKELLGILTISDVIWKAVSRMEIQDPIEKYMEETIFAMWDGTPLKVAYELIRLSKGRALPVLDSDGKLGGIVGDNDLLGAAQLIESTHKSEMSAGSEGDKWGWDSKNVIYITKKKLALPDKTVGEIMVKNVITAIKNTSVSECAKKMAKAKVEQLPVIDAEGTLIGMIRDMDLLRAVK